MSWRLDASWAIITTIRDYTHPVIPLIWKFPKCCRYSCSVFPGNFEARNWTGDMVGTSESTWCCAKYPLQRRRRKESAKLVYFTNSHSKSTISVHLPTQGAQFTSQYLDSARAQKWITRKSEMENGPNSVDFPEPLAPTMAILESKPTSILAPRNTTFSGVYPNVTSDICNNGGEIFSVSGSLSQS